MNEELLLSRRRRAPNVLMFGPTNPLYIAHRGSALLYPEDTMEAFAASIAAGAKAIEPDCHLLSDGELGVMHDATVDRTTTSTGNVSALNTAAFRALNIDADAFFGTNYFGNTLHPPLFSDVLTAYANKVILVPEAKVTGAVTPMLTKLSNTNAKSTVIFQSTTLTDLTAPLAAGYQCMFVHDGTGNMASAQSAGVQWAAIATTAADSVFTTWIAAGFKVIAYLVEKRWQRDKYLGLGCSGFFTDDETYVKGNAALVSADTFVNQRWMPGQIYSDSYTLGDWTLRGKFYSPDQWGHDTNANVSFVLMGALCPRPNTSAYTVDTKVTYTSANGGDATRWAGIFLAASTMGDRAYYDAGNAEEAGYNCFIRKNGAMVVVKRTGATTVSVATGTSAAIADGEEIRMSVAVTPTTVTLNRLNPSTGAVLVSATATDSTYRGLPYFHLGKSALGCKFRAITVS